MSEEELSVDEELAEFPESLEIDDELLNSDSIDDVDLGFKASATEEY